MVEKLGLGFSSLYNNIYQPQLNNSNFLSSVNSQLIICSISWLSVSTVFWAIYFKICYKKFFSADCTYKDMSLVAVVLLGWWLFIRRHLCSKCMKIGSKIFCINFFANRAEHYTCLSYPPVKVSGGENPNLPTSSLLFYIPLASSLYVHIPHASLSPFHICIFPLPSLIFILHSLPSFCTSPASISSLP